MHRRWWTALVLSIAAHLAVVGAAVGLLLVNGLSLSLPIDVEITGMRLDEVHDLPLGAPAGAGDSAPPAAPRARRRAPKPPASEGELAGHDPAADEKAGSGPDPEADPAGPRATSLRQYGPEGSRVTVLLRLDRLRDTAYAPALDAILGRLPDRRDLLDGTGLDLFQSLDALLIATPNPRDYAVTFLAARHRLKDRELRAALDRGAKATNRVLTWRTEGHRPFAERRARLPGTGASRDERLIVLPAPGLVVVTPPIYRALLLASARPPARTAPDAGADAGGDGLARGGGGARASPDGGAGGGAAEAQWGALLRRIDAEDGILPLDAVAMISAVDLFSARGLARGLAVVPPGAAGGSNGSGAPGAPGGSGTVAGMEIPKVLTASIGIAPSPFLDVVAEFETEEQARHWESAWPSMHQRFKTNPYVILTGFGALVARAELTRVASTIRLHQIATEPETLRLLQLAARLLGAEPIASP